MIHILGSGSIGCVLASKIQRPVSLICRTMPKQHSLIYELPDGVTRSIEDIQFQNASTITQIICTKAGEDTYNAVSSVQHALSKDSSILFLQNGFKRNEKLIKDTNIEKKSQILNSMITFGAFLREKFHVVDAGTGILRTSTNLEEPLNDNSKKLIDVLRKTNYTIEVVSPKDLEKTLKSKIAVNCVVNMLGALLKATSGELYEKAYASNDQHMPSNEQLIDDVLKEVCQVLDLDLAIKTDLTRKASLATSTNFNSTARDYHIRKLAMPETEIKYITGYVIEEGKAKGIPTPVNNTLYNLFAMMSHLREIKQL
ncbi:hypothetical protein E3Q06_04402 [Wallemia mellicola]|nr:hypothetical protein E3Q21_04408 [Wallemia mellicola]TIB82638.1 hypothetical protein E3Q20_04404 [Wallemia mellicola]TIC36667.1 hypothetical protein E3Q07_04401 [Wallemia mellicola]TIC43219.1 hypothetical protein E3Q06_04402 [Wallemia mellicola]